LLQVFLSSEMGAGSLDAERRAIRRAIEPMKYVSCWSWEDSAFPGSFPPMDLCLDEVRRSHVLVLVVGYDLTGNTRREVEEALRLDLTCLVFVKEGELGEEAQGFLEGIQSNVTYWYFRNAGELGTLVTDALDRNMALALRQMVGRPRIGSAEPSFDHSGGGAPR
jgi:hypothetical protein